VSHINEHASTLEEIDAFVQESLPKVTSVMIVQHGHLVFERYFSGDVSTIRPMANETTSVVSALIGAATKQGRIQSVDEKMRDFFPEKARNTRDLRLIEVTLRHLLTMPDGISSSGNMIEIFFADEIQCKPLAKDPGAEFHFNGMSPQILSMIITKTTGMKALDFGEKHLFGPLGFAEVVWSGLGGYSRGLYGILLTSRDMARFGYLYLKKGVWDQTAILLAGWVTASTSSHVTTGETSAFWKNYGFNWWVCGFGPYRGCYAFGLAGQTICVVPDLDLVTVVTSAETAAFRPYRNFTDENLKKYPVFVNTHLITAIGE
jgi:CubicO group peptidase (beta-lactamase class C family)